MKKLLVGLTLAGSLLISGISVGAESFKGVSVNQVHYNSSEVAIKNDNAYTTTITVTPQIKYGDNEWVNSGVPQTFTLKPEEKIYKIIELTDDGYDPKTNLTRYKVVSVGHGYSHDIDLGTFYSNSPVK